jgi:hypothetical protein
MNRRGFLKGVAALFAAPAIIKTTGLIMPVRNHNIMPYKGRISFDAACFYCPYIPLQMIDGDFNGLEQKKVSYGFRTRYGRVDSSASYYQDTRTTYAGPRYGY